MNETIFNLCRDFYSLKMEYDINMQQLSKTNQKQNAEIEKLRKSLNQLREHVEENDQKSGGE